MKLTDYFIPTLKEIPKDAEAKSHIAMLRSGMIRKLSSGYYSYLPLGLRVLRKAENIVREEMNRAGALEVLLPAVHPVEVWKKTGRYEVMEEIFLKIEKGGREYVLGPTHEEIITELATAYLKSYKDLPKIFYQIQTKFRHEARPRFGVIRSREFIMKDAYSFDRDLADLNENYEKMRQAYERIFTRCGLSFVVVEADSGAMGGSGSQEFMVLVDFGEDRVVISEASRKAWSVEVAACSRLQGPAAEAPREVESLETKNLKTIEELTNRLAIEASRFIKTILYQAGEEVVAVLVRGDHEICEPKLARVLGCAQLRLADEKTIREVTGASVGFSGPVGLKKKIKIVADFSVEYLANGIVGANRDDEHLRNVNPGRDFQPDLFADVRLIKEGDPCPDGSEQAKIHTSLEIGHIFKLGNKYTKAFDGFFTDKEGKSTEILMGCYGIGVNRIVAACLEQHFGEKGMVWPMSLSPFHIHLVTANQTSDRVIQAAEVLYEALTNAGLDVLYDNRDERMGIKLNDAELIGIPLQIVIGDRGLGQGTVEIRNRLLNSQENMPVEEVATRLVSWVGEEIERGKHGKS